MSTTSTDIFRRAGIDAERDEQARQAVLEGRKLLPTLNSYVRAIAGRKDLIVEMATRDNGSTSGSRIYWRPPMALGDKSPHNRLQCNKRGDDMQLLCSACAKREDVLVIIYHEIAHNIFGSFQEVEEKDKLDLMAQAIESTGGRWAKQIKARIESAPSWSKSSYISMCGLINEYLPLLFNALEDARVNREMFKSRKGLKGMFDAQVTRIFNEGVEQLDAFGKPTVIKWEDYPLNSQILVGCFAKASGYDYAGWFQPSVVAALDDDALTAILNRLGTVRSAAGVYHLGFPVLARLRELGFCELPDDPDPEPEEEDESEDPAEQEPSPDPEGDMEDGEPGDTDGEPGAGEEPDPAEPESGSEGGDSSEEDEAGNDGGEGSSEGPAAGQPEPDSEGGDGEVSPDSSEDLSDDEPGSSGGMGEPDSSEEMDDGTDDPESGSGGSGADGEAGATGGDSPGEADTDDPQQTAESYRGTGDISDSNEGGSPEQEPVDEEDAGSGNGASGSADGSAREPGAPESDDASDLDPGDQSDSGDPLPDDAGLDEGSPGSGSDDGGADADTGLPEGDVDDLPGESDPSGAGADGPTDPTVGEQPSSDQGGNAADESDVSFGDAPPSDSGDDATDSGDAPEDHVGGEQPSPGDLDEDAVDTGADRGLGGTELIENPANEEKELDRGTPEDARVALLKLGDHEEPPKRLHEEELNEEAIDRAIVQGIYFETPSRHIFGVREHRYGIPYEVDGTNMSLAWEHDSHFYSGMSKSQLGIEGDFDPPEQVLGGALVRMRVAFSDNARGKSEQHLKAGKVNPRVLGKRAWNGDERLFRKRTMPGKKSYFVLIGMDVSGSTIGKNIALEKRAVMAQAELCHRMGIKFAIFAHSGNYHKPRGSRAEGMDLDIYIIKEHNQPWNDEVKIALREIGPDNCNLDGHTLEYYRKYIERRPETDKIILYYTDGKMPAENHDEELVILQREIKVCKRKNITLLGVGIRTDSPVRHGLDTVQVDTDEDIVKVVRHLEKRLSVSTRTG